MAIELSEKFKSAVRRVWPNGSVAVLELADIEAWDQGEHGEDHDDQLTTAEELGIIVGRSRSEGVESFFSRYTKWLNRNDDFDNYNIDAD
ncbi:MAG: hypothetical protein Q8P83_00960 [bacterium]|nr:hypothetical protein [bacterium]